MFSDHDIEASGFCSNWNFSRETSESGVQTSELVTLDKDVQSKEFRPASVQTEEPCSQPRAVDYNEDRLAAFLAKVCPAVVKELDRVGRSNAFTSYALMEDTDEEVKEVTTLKLSEAEGRKVSELSWSCTGSVLAIALSHTLHPSWCSHQGIIHLYNVDRVSKAAKRTLEAPSCVVSIEMHPYLTSIIAAGTSSGEVLVWDVSQEDAQPLSNTAHACHNDKITQVSWVLGAGSSVTLASSALDGQLFLWKVSPQLFSYSVLERFKCVATQGDPGISCFAFPQHQQDKFVLALEGGALTHCSIAAAVPVPSVTGGESVKDPTINSFEAQPATVTRVEFSPFHDDTFATISTDQAIRIYSLFKDKHSRVIWLDGVSVGLAWSPSQPFLLAVWGSSEFVTLHNTQNGENIGTLIPNDSQHKNHLSAVAFNAKSPRLFAVGSLDGTVQVWEIPSTLSSKTKHL